MNNPPIAALEIGTYRVRALIGDHRPENNLLITGVGECPSRGVRKGEIVDFDNALACVRTALRQAEEMAQVTLYNVHLLISGGHFKSMTNRGTVPVTNPDHLVGPEEIEDVMNNARAVNLPMEREVIHSICQHFYLDDQQRVINPDGMEANRLSLDMLILHGLRNSQRNTIRVASEAEVNVLDSAFSGLCSALAVLTAEQKEGGVLVIDMGAGTTDFVVYANKTLAHAGVLAMGGDHVTNDLALGLNLPTAQAEKLKIQHASCMPDLSRRSQVLRIPAEGGFDGKEVSQADVNLITHARMEETLCLIRDELAEKGLHQRLGAGVVLTGGGSRLREIGRLVDRVLEMPCAIGTPRGVSGLAGAVEKPEFAAPVGMLRYGLRNLDKNLPRMTLSGIIKSIFWR